MPNFYPDIYEYLDGTETAKSVSVPHLEELILKVRAHTGLSKEACGLIVKRFFQEIRNGMLRGEIVTFRGFGNFMIVSPKVTDSKRKIFPKFKPSPKLLAKINDRQS